MPEYRLTLKADEDIGHIFDYTAREFGARQAESYLLGLEETLRDLVANPDLAYQIDDIRKGYRRYLFQSHAIYFTLDRDHITIVRVLHERMDVLRHLR